MAAAALLCFFVCGHVVDAEGLLLHVSLLYRHGDRSPIATFPNDQLGATAWPEGFGVLTQRGVRQQFELGRFLRQRYKNFINATYIPSEISVRSSEFSRTLQSAFSCLTGFYNISAHPAGTPNASWQPVPVSFVPKKDDTLLGLASCPARDRAHSNIEESEEMQAFFQKYPLFASSVSVLAGYKESSMENLATIYDSLYCLAQNDFPIPSWANWTNLTDTSNKTTVGILDELSDLALTVSTRGQTVRRLSAGLLIGEIVQNMENRASGKQRTKLAMYSAHDSTVASLLSSLDVFDGKRPHYAAVVILELSMEKDEPVVRVYYKNGPEVNEPVLLNLPGCKTPCSLGRFKALVTELVPSDYEAECGFVDGHSNRTDGHGIIIAIAVPASLLFIIMLGVLIFCCRRRPRYQTERSKSWRAQRPASREASGMLNS